jgi:hypothetical protein
MPGKYSSDVNIRGIHPPHNENDRRKRGVSPNKDVIVAKKGS